MKTMKYIEKMKDGLKENKEIHKQKWKKEKKKQRNT